MKALWLEAARKVEYGDYPEPVPPADWVRIKVLAASVCGGDVKVYRNGRPGNNTEKTISGHEFFGIIDMLGENVHDWSIGQRVCVYPQIYCRECDDCKSGNMNVCEHRGMVGGKGNNGGFAEYVIAPAFVLIEVPDGVSDVEAAMTEPFAVGMHAAKAAGGWDLMDKSVAIYGAGPIALFALESVKYFGAKQIIMLDIAPEKLEVAKAHGATDTVLVGDDGEALQKAVKELAGGRGVDAVIDAVCIDSSIDNEMHFCKPHGKIAVVGLSQSQCSVNFRYLIDHEMTIRGAYLYTTEMEECLQLISQGLIRTDYIASPVVPLSKGTETFRKLADEPAQCLKAVFIPDSVSEG